MSRRVPWRGHDNYSPVAKYIVLALSENHGLAVLQRAVILWLRAGRRRIGEHYVPFGLGYQPRRTGKQIGVPNVIPMEVREREISDIGWRITHLGQLCPQRLHRGRVSNGARPTARLKRAIGNSPGVPHQRAFWMDHQEARH